MIGTLVWAATVDGRWVPGIGDPTPIGWLTVFAYLAAAGLCGRVWAKERINGRAGTPAAPLFWFILTILMIALGINKQLDLQSLLTAIGRDVASSQGWYENRGSVQIAFIIAIFIVGLLALGFFGWLGRRQFRRTFPALLGTILLFAFVVIRAASFHHVDVFLKMHLAGLRWNAVLELGGISLVILAAVYADKTRPTPRSKVERTTPDSREDSKGVRKYSYRVVPPTNRPGR